jgi:GGDEF domain-containing protein
MNRLTPVWTRVHPRLFAALALPIGATALAAAVEPVPVAVALAVLVYVATLAGLMFDTFVATLVGVGLCALAIMVKRFFGTWTEAAFATSAGELLLIVLTAAAFGIAASGLRRMKQAATVKTGSGTAFGSLGLLPPEIGELRLEAEVERAAKYNRPLSLLGVTTEELEGELTPAERDAVRRAAARLVDSMLRVTDVAYAHDAGQIVLVLPETRLQDAWLLMGRLSDAVDQATFTADEGRERKALREVARVHLAAATFPQHGTTPQALLASTFRQPMPPAQETVAVQ